MQRKSEKLGVAFAVFMLVATFVVLFATSNVGAEPEAPASAPATVSQPR